jgi:hypothetical protein
MASATMSGGGERQQPTLPRFVRGFQLLEQLPDLGCGDGVLDGGYG